MVFCSILSLLLTLFILHFWESHLMKKCKYDCDTCKNWNCSYHYCQKKKSQNNQS